MFLCDPSFDPIHYVSRIDEPYNELVGDDKPGFLAIVQTQMAQLLNTEIRNMPLERMNARPGSTIVTMQILGYTDEEAAELETSYSDLAQMFEDGDVELVRERSLFS